MCFILCISTERVCPDGWDRSLLTRSFQLCRFARKTMGIWQCWSEIPTGQLESGQGFADVKHKWTNAQQMSQRAKPT